MLIEYAIHISQKFLILCELKFSHTVLWVGWWKTALLHRWGPLSGCEVSIGANIARSCSYSVIFMGYRNDGNDGSKFHSVQ